MNNIYFTIAESSKYIMIAVTHKQYFCRIIF